MPYTASVFLAAALRILPHYELPPGTQILHCLRNDAVGGESLLSDGIAVANLDA